MKETETSNIPKRLIYFTGHSKQSSSALITRICKNYETISDIFTGECATRTLSNLYNLHTVRGTILGNTLLLDSSMSGPHHYFGFILPTNTHIIKFDEITGYPTYYKITNSNTDYNQLQNTISEDKIIKLSNYKWISGSRNETLQKDSLFVNPGLLLINNKTLLFNVIENGYDFDLSSFKVKLVKNDIPFKFNQNLITKYKHAQHKLRVITYNYGINYVNNYLMNDSGIFIERHEFIQAITPMNANCSGFVVLGRCNESNVLELIAVTIPFGYTLLVEPWAIHGDSTLVGMYMMAMTGNHNAMKTADTVFIKNLTTLNNVSIIGVNMNINTMLSITDDILMTSDKMSLSKLHNCDQILKKTIKKELFSSNQLLNLIYQPVMLTGNYVIGWYKTLGIRLPNPTPNPNI